MLDIAREIFNHHLMGVRNMLEEVQGTPIKAMRQRASKRVR